MLVDILQGLLIVLIVLFVFFAFWYACKRYSDNFAIVKSNLDGKNYYIRGTTPDKQKEESANYLAKLSERITKLVTYMYDKKLPNQEISNRLMNRWKNCTLKETSEGEKSAAYTVNKGDEMRICIRDGNNLEDINTSMFVLLHELAHLMSNSYGHNSEFKENFNYIVHLATSIGTYKPQEFDKEPVKYCGNVVTIHSTPCSDGLCEETTIPTDKPYGPLF